MSEFERKRRVELEKLAVLRRESREALEELNRERQHRSVQERRANPSPVRRGQAIGSETFAQVFDREAQTESARRGEVRRRELRWYERTGYKIGGAVLGLTVIFGGAAALKAEADKPGRITITTSSGDARRELVAGEGKPVEQNSPEAVRELDEAIRATYESERAQEMIHDFNQMYSDHNAPEMLPRLIDATRDYMNPIIEGNDIEGMEIGLKLMLDTDYRRKILTKLYEARQSGERKGHEPLPKEYEGFVSEHFPDKIYDYKYDQQGNIIKDENTGEPIYDHDKIISKAVYEAMAVSLETAQLEKAYGLYSDEVNSIMDPATRTAMFATESGGGEHIGDKAAMSEFTDSSYGGIFRRALSYIMQYDGIWYPSEAYPGSVGAGAVGPAQSMPFNIENQMNFIKDSKMPPYYRNILDMHGAALFANGYMQSYKYDAKTFNVQHPKEKVTYYTNAEDQQTMYNTFWNRPWNHDDKQVRRIRDTHFAFIQQFPDWQEEVFGK